MHYVNRTATEFPGEARANLHAVDAAAVRHVAGTLNLGNGDVELPPGRRATLVKAFRARRAMTVFALTSHTHALGERFVIRVRGGARDGEVVYTNTSWEHPAFTMLDRPLVPQPGEALVSEITWNNTTARTVRFGLTSEAEMGIIFGYYY